MVEKLISRYDLPLKAKELVIKSVKRRMKVDDSISKETQTETFLGIPDNELIPFGKWLAQTILMTQKMVKPKPSKRKNYGLQPEVKNHEDKKKRLFRLNEERLWNIGLQINTHSPKRTKSENIERTNFNKESFNNRVLEELQMLDTIDIKVYDFIHCLSKALISFNPHIDENAGKLVVYLYFSELVKRKAEQEIKKYVETDAISDEFKQDFKEITYTNFQELRVKSIKKISGISYEILKFHSERFLHQAFLRV